MIMTKTPQNGTTLQTNAAGEAVCLKLDPRLDGQAAAVLGDRLRHAVRDGMAVTLDADAVERMTTNAAQVLLAADEAAAADGKALVVRSPSDVFLSAFADLGVPAETMHWSIEA